MIPGPALESEQPGFHCIMGAHLDSSGSSHKARVMVVEDHPLVRAGIVALVNCQPDLNCCGQTDSIAGARTMHAEQKPDLILLDLRLKDGEAFELISAMKAQSPNVPILVVSQREETLFAERVLQLGANGYIMKQEAPDDLVAAMRTVLTGSTYVSGRMGTILRNRH